MSTSTATVAARPKLTGLRFSSTIISRFVARRTMKGATFWALLFGLIVTSKAIGYATAYPTAHGRAKLASSFGNNIGLKALLGVPHDLSSVTGFTAWNTLGVMVIIGSIWALLLATKTLRGEEDNGRWEILLSGQTTARRATINALAGLTSTLTLFYIVMAVIFIAVGHDHKVNYASSSALFFSLTVVAVVAVFMMLGAFASQLMPTRSRAASLAAGVFGICFLIRAVADTTSAAWLLNATPLGWAEKTQPLFDARPIWLLPLFGLALILAGLAVYLSGRRDLGESTFPDKDIAKPHTGLLNSPLQAAVRLSRTANIAWLTAISLVTLFFALLTKSAAQAFSGATRLQSKLGHLVHTTQTFDATIFLSVIFLLLMCITMAYAASALGTVREEEANGRLDNLLVGPFSRLQWLGGRLLIVTLTTVIAGLLIGAVAWIGTSDQGLGIAFHILILAGINAIIPAIFTIGLAVFAFGFVARLTNLVAYSVIAWSFMLNIISAGLNLNHWILDTSIFQHVVLAPAASPNWGRDGVIVVIAIILAGLGALRFNRRDLQSE